MTPYQVATGLRPRTPLSALLSRAGAEAITAEACMKELMEASKGVYELVERAQGRRAEQARRRAGEGRQPRELQ
eukprot:8490608-Alexandrium_andersonii.AAC.1